MTTKVASQVGREMADDERRVTLARLAASKRLEDPSTWFLFQSFPLSYKVEASPYAQFDENSIAPKSLGEWQ